MLSDADWNKLAAKLGLPVDWREQGFDSPEYMLSKDSLYRTQRRRGFKFYCYAYQCGFETNDVVKLFSHVHKHK